MTSPFFDRLAGYDALARQAALAHVTSDDLTDHLTVPAADYLRRGGKGLRPALCLATCEAFGGSVDDALPSAAALELVHTAFLVHDDVEDDSELRRGRPTLHQTYGRALAVNTGDALAVIAMGVLRENDRRLGRRLAARVWSEFAFMARQTVDGQARELGWQRDGRLDLTPDDYLDLIMKKTCWYTTVLPLRVGALVGAKRDVDLDSLLRFGFYLGAAFQIRDDVLNLTAPTDLYGKENLGDLREGKRTLMLIHLLEAADATDRRCVTQVLAKPRQERSADDLLLVRELMDTYGSIAFAEHFAAGIAESAAVAFEQAFVDAPPSPARRFVADLVPYMVDRDH